MTAHTPPIPFRYVFTPCCVNQSTVYFNGDSSILGTLPRVLVYTGTSPYTDAYGNSLVPGACYTVSIEELTQGQPNETVFPPKYSSNFSDSTGCDDAEVCPECTPTCYFLMPCSSQFEAIYTTTNLSSYLGQHINIIYDEQEYCVFVTIIPNQCYNPVPVVFSSLCSCTTNCYYIANTTAPLYYINTDDELVTLTPSQIAPYTKVCSQVYPQTFNSPNLQIESLGTCTNGVCPQLCFKLTNCENSNIVKYSKSPNLITYAINNGVVKLSSEDGCWTVEISEVCDCPVDLVVTQYFPDCIACTGYKNYKLINCENNSIKYTSNDLEQYVGQVVEISENGIACPGCWTVEKFTLQIQNNNNVVVVNTFVDCKECLQEYWLLEDCAGEAADIITITDLSLFVGEVVRLTWCPDICWTVSETRLHNNSTIVFLENNYVTCSECLVDVLPCVCTSFTNTGGQIITDLEYYDCEGNIQTIDSIQPGEITDKYCLKSVINKPAELVKNEFGDCTGTAPNFICPVVPVPTRTVRPGYNTPGCSIEYYENVSCNFAESMYSDVLERRYGITACCIEDRMKWEIKYALLEFTSNINPEYTCTPANTCCNTCQSKTCNCQ